MNLWTTSMKRVALALLAAAVVVPAAQAAGSRAPVAGYSHLQDLTAMANRYHTQASSLGFAPAGCAHLQELTAMVNRFYNTQATMPAGCFGYRAHTSRLASVRKPTATAGGFDWVDAGIGATSGFGVALALAGTLLFVLRRRPRVQDASTPTTA